MILNLQNEMNTFTKKLIKVNAIILTGLIAGAVFGIWIGYDPEGLSATTYVEQQQHTIHALNVLMPVLGLISLILTCYYAYFVRNHILHRNLLLIAIFLLILSALITRLGNQPINAIVIKWDLNNIPESWIELKTKWWRLHTIRTISTLLAFALIVWTTFPSTKAKESN